MPVSVRAGAHPVWHQQLLPQLAQEATHTQAKPGLGQGCSSCHHVVCQKLGKTLRRSQVHPRHKRGTSLTLPSL